MLTPYNICTITKAGTLDVYGQEAPGAIIPSKCAIVKLASASQKTSVRADSSASRGNAQETTNDARLLFLPNVDIEIGDKIELLGFTLKVDGVFPRVDVGGRVHHFQVDANVWA